MDRRLWILPGLIVALFFWLLRGEAQGPEDQVRAVVEQIASGARAGDLEAVVEPVSERYHDEDGLDRQQLVGFVFATLRKHKQVGVVLGPVGVVLHDPAHASARFDAALADGVEISSLDLLPDAAELWHFEVELVLEDGAWRVLSQRHSPRGGACSWPWSCPS